MLKHNLGIAKLLRLPPLAIYYGILRWLPSSGAPGGSLWRKMRYLTCSYLFKECGREVNIEAKAFFESGRHISIGYRSNLGINCSINGKVTIGKNVLMGPDVMIFTRNHEFMRTDMPIIEQGNQKERTVTIGDDVWIGARVIILPGVTVGHGVVIGAGSVVTRNLPDFSICAGNPAQVIRYR